MNKRINKHSIRLMYTKDECYTESLKYDSRLEFEKNSKSIYKCAELNEWLNDFPHLRTKNTPLKTRYTKFECYNIFLKCKDMLVFKNKYHLYYKCASINGWLDEFKKPKNTKIEKYTKTQCKLSAINYTTKSEFASKGKKYYEFALKNGWLNEICSHMTNNIYDKNYWTKELCNTEALKYNSRSDFELGNLSAYHISKTNNWLDEICSHMIVDVSDCFWTKQRCRIEASKYPKKSHFCYYAEKAYKISIKNDWIDDICKHMIGDDGERFLTLTDKEKCFNEALKYSSMREFFEKSIVIFEKCKDNKWFAEACKHMPTHTLPAGYWTKERCGVEAKKYKTITDFRANAKGAYNRILENKWNELDIHLR